MIITGNTYPVKDKLKALGGRWNTEAKGWDVPETNVEKAQALVNSAPIQQRSTRTFRPPAQTKQCWECGSSFSYTDAQRNGGDWQDSYCGC